MPAIDIRSLRVNPSDLSRIDMNLLTVLVALVRERHVSRAAQKLHLGQPAVSHALARLRELTGDPLLVRQGRFMQPTERALVLMEGLAPALEQIESTLRSQAPFDPGSARRVFHVGLTDDLQIAVLPSLLRTLRAHAPHARLIAHTVCYRNAMEHLLEGRVDTVVAYLEHLPAAAKMRTVGTVRYAILHAGTGARVSLDEYCRRPHVLVSFAGDLRGVVDDPLEQLGRRREVVFSVPQFGSLPAVLAGTDLLATVPEYAARALSAGSGLRVSPLPFEGPSFPITMAWRAAVDKDPSQAWLRQAIVAAMQEPEESRRAA